MSPSLQETERERRDVEVFASFVAFCGCSGISSTMTQSPENADTVLRWLLEGDPAIRWQVLRDVVGAAESLVERERQRVAREGWGARLLAKQDPEGIWAEGLSSDGGLYSPKWISTTYTMLLLRDFGLPATHRQVR